MEFDIALLIKRNRATRQPRLNGKFCTKHAKKRNESERIEFSEERERRKAEALAKLLINQSHTISGKRVAQHTK